MEKRMEKWESLRLEAQTFTPQTFVAVCTEIKEYHIDAFSTCSGSYKVSCGGHQHTISNSAGSITVNPAGADSSSYGSVANFMQTVYNMINNSDLFSVTCGGTTAQVHILTRRDGSLGTVIDPTTLSNWTPAPCDIPNSDFNAAHSFVPGDTWEEVLKNQS